MLEMSWIKDRLKPIIPVPLFNLRNMMSGARLAVSPGHFYSPICSPSDLARYYRDPSSVLETTIYGIDLNEPGQRDLWDSWRVYLREFPFPDSKAAFRYYCQNPAFAVGDATILYCMLRHFKPRHFIEIGSGFSSACTLDTIEHYLDDDVGCTFIEPFPNLLRSLINSDDESGHRIIPKQVQDVPLTTFDQLEAGDILFIDSTHILKTGSDVGFELFNVLPRLKSGVIVHFHDIFFPFEYPRQWVIERNYSWNEIYAVRAFLMNNAEYQILFFNDYFARFARKLVERDAPRMLENPGGGLWIRRV
jgi:Methyltransferase domain